MFVEPLPSQNFIQTTQTSSWYTTQPHGSYMPVLQSQSQNTSNSVSVSNPDYTGALIVGAIIVVIIILAMI